MVDLPRVDSCAGSVLVIDLHSHLLPGLDDGAPDFDESIRMARMFVADGTTTLACTPHILPGVYGNDGTGIKIAVAVLQRALSEQGIGLRLVEGADNHIVPDFVSGLKSGRLLTLGGTRYVLVEPPHHVLPPRIDALFFDILANGYVPLLTHPERMTWIEGNYELLKLLRSRGVLMQLTAGAVTGDFGRRAKYWSERMLDDRVVDIIASDAHGSDRRVPGLSRAFSAAARRVGDAEATHLVLTRPQGILEDLAPDQLPAVLGVGGSRGEISNVGGAFEDPAEFAAWPDAAGAEGGHARRDRGIAQRLRRVFER